MLGGFALTFLRFFAMGSPTTALPLVTSSEANPLAAPERAGIAIEVSDSSSRAASLERSISFAHRSIAHTSSAAFVPPESSSFTGEAQHSVHEDASETMFVVGSWKSPALAPTSASTESRSFFASRNEFAPFSRIVTGSSFLGSVFSGVWSGSCFMSLEGAFALSETTFASRAISSSPTESSSSSITRDFFAFEEDEGRSKSSSEEDKKPELSILLRPPLFCRRRFLLLSEFFFLHNFSSSPSTSGK
mmetsp:Transcript_25719/g.75869  ORF Transcript_25719/g.75869 Transcript_25719/m.75869 type:complete len:247 (-) Transcript_25719:3400-4140(-)